MVENEIKFLLYTTPEEHVAVQAIVKDETLWLTQRSMAELFGCSSDNISLHLKNIYNESELREEATTEKISVVQKEGSRNVSRTSTFYNLDAIISVGYRVNSSKATKFRIWATQRQEPNAMRSTRRSVFKKIGIGGRPSCYVLSCGKP